MPSVRLSKKDKESLLTKLRDGHDLESAGAALGLTEGQIGVAQGKHGPEMVKAFKTGTARLRARIMEAALDDNNTATLLRLLEQREKQSEQADPITLVERIIVSATCQHCGKYTGDVGNPILNAGDKEPSTEKVKTPNAMGVTDDNLPVDAMEEKVQKRSYMVLGGI